MHSLDKEKIEFALGNREIWQGKKAENVVILLLASGFAALFVSDSWFWHIQTTGLIIFYVKI